MPSISLVSAPGQVNLALQGRNVCCTSEPTLHATSLKWWAHVLASYCESFVCCFTAAKPDSFLRVCCCVV